MEILFIIGFFANILVLAICGIINVICMGAGGITALLCNKQK